MNPTFICIDLFFRIFPSFFYLCRLKIEKILKYLIEFSLTISIRKNDTITSLLNENLIIPSSTNQFGIVRKTTTNNL